MQDLLEAWGEAVAEALQDAGISARQLALRCDVHPTTIGRIISGKLNPNDELKWKIAGVLGVRMDRLWSYPQIIPPVPQAVA
jgi:ribosome-binding protein aMBF1 (putative translation factor)